MKKRLRKKLRTGEFKEMGFYVRFRLPEDISEVELDTVLDHFIDDAIEVNGLEYGGGGDTEWEGFVTLNRRGSVTEDQRGKVIAWLSGNPRIIEHEVSELMDAWHD